MADQKEQKEQKALEHLRSRIDAVDSEIHSRLNERARLAQQVAQLKTSNALDGASPNFYRPAREAQLLRKIMEHNQGPLTDKVIGRLFREIMSACLEVEQAVSVVYLGPEATFTHAAALRHFGKSAKYQPMTGVSEVFRQVESGAAGFGVVPIENSTEGMVNHTLDCLIRSPLKICGEVVLPIHHHLLVNRDAREDQIQRICSHQQSLAQCRKWLERCWPSTPHAEFYSTAEAARKARLDPTVAAIAGDMAMEHYDLVALSSCIEDQPGNQTRFIVISREAALPSGKDKTSILVYARNRPGVLYRTLEPFSVHDINLIRIESRPDDRGDWSYVFFLDFDGHEQDEPIKKLLQSVEKTVLEIKSLGSYPRDVFE